MERMESKAPADPSILHLDQRVVVVRKPSGLLSVPGIGPENADCVIARLRRHLPEARIVHRLDQATSGLMVLALDAEAHRHLSRQFEQRTVEKEYMAVVAGAPTDDQGLIDLPMRKDMERRARHMIDPQRGKPALTRWQVLRRAGDRSLLLLRPHTGRSHQLRLHLASIGHAILGDDIYAPPEVAAAAPRLMLHASRLELEDPDSGARRQWRDEPDWRERWEGGSG